jgi:type IV fimbrial biogenesis protein FimT
MLPRVFSMTSPHPAGKTRGERGFTLIELVFTVAVLAILVTLAAPSLRDLVRDQRIKTATFEVYSSLTYARSEAIKRNASVTIVIASGTDWAAGWTVQDGGGTTLKTQAVLNSINITGPASPITYQRDGRLGGTANPTFLLKSAESDSITARCVRVDLSGRPNVKVDTNHDPSDGCQ